MAPVFDQSDLIRFPNWQAAMMALFKGQTLEPFSVETIPPQKAPRPERAQKVREASRRAHLERV
jgi:hypothetical protein